MGAVYFDARFKLDGSACTCIAWSQSFPLLAIASSDGSVTIVNDAVGLTTVSAVSLTIARGSQ